MKTENHVKGKKTVKLLTFNLWRHGRRTEFAIQWKITFKCQIEYMINIYAYYGAKRFFLL